MPAAEGEPELPEQDVDLTGVVGADLDEVEGGRFGHSGQPHDRVGAEGLRRAAAGGDDVLHPRERTPCLAGGPGDIGLPEDVVEHLERERPVVPRAEDVAHERTEVEGTLAREQPVVARPGQHVHGQQRSVCELEEEDLRSRDLLDRAGIVAAGEDVEAVEAGADGLDDPRAPRFARRDGSRRRTVPRPALRRRSGRRAPRPPRPTGAAARRRPRRRRCVAVATLLHTSIVSMPSRSMSANFARALRRTPSSSASVTPSASRNGW